MTTVGIWVDGSCRGNPGPGGWAAVLTYGEHEKQISGREADTTNQRMELRATLEGLKAMKADKRREIVVYTDSQYVEWVLTGAMKKVPKENARLIAEVIEVAEHHDVRCSKVKGHAGTDKNERVHVLAMRESAKAALRKTALRKTLEDDA